MSANAPVVAHLDGGGIYESDPSATAPALEEVEQQRRSNGGHQLNKAIVTDQTWKLIVQMNHDILCVEGFEVPILGFMEQDQQGHDLTGRQPRWAHTLDGTTAE